MGAAQQREEAEEWNGLDGSVVTWEVGDWWCERRDRAGVGVVEFEVESELDCGERGRRGRRMEDREEREEKRRVEKMLQFGRGEQ
jgi:hypothetical protein